MEPSLEGSILFVRNWDVSSATDFAMAQIVASSNGETAGEDDTITQRYWRASTDAGSFKACKKV